MKELSGSRNMAGCSRDLHSAISGDLLGRKGFFTTAHQSYRHGAASSDNLLAPYSPQYFKKITALIHSGWKSRTVSLLISEGFVS